MRCSLVIPTWNHAAFLRRSLASYTCQAPGFDWELIVVNDGSTDETPRVLAEFPQVSVINLPPKKKSTNPAKALNVGFRAAKGEIIIFHSDDIVHVSDNVIRELCDAMQPGCFVQGAVRPAFPQDDAPPQKWKIDKKCMKGWFQHSVHIPRSLFYLGALWRRDLYQIGGYDERFTKSWWSDLWFADCLIKGIGKTAIWRDDIIAYHQQHDGRTVGEDESMKVLNQLRAEAEAKGTWHTADAPWNYGD